MRTLAQLKEYIQRKLKGDHAVKRCSHDQIAGVMDDTPMTISGVGGRVEITSSTRWELNGCGNSIQRNERARLVTSEPYTKRYVHTMHIPIGHVVTANGSFEWHAGSTTNDKAVWEYSPIPADVVGNVDIRLRTPLGIGGCATSVYIKPITEV